jgi:hypothetical protein
MKWLSKFISGLLIGVLFSLTASFILDSTIFNSSFVKDHAGKSNLYEGLAEELPRLIVPAAPANPGTQRTQQLLSELITPDYVRNKLEPIFDAMETHLREGAPPPVLDLTDLGRQATAAGLPLPQDGPLSQPIPLGQASGAEQQPHPLLQAIKTVQAIGLVAALVLSAALLLSAGHSRKVTALVKPALAVALLLILVAGLLKVAPGILGSALTRNPDLGSLQEPLRRLFESMSLSVSERFFIAGLAYLLTAIVLGLAGWHLSRKSKTITEAKQQRPGRE